MNRNIKILVVILLCIGLIPLVRTLLGLSFLSVINFVTRPNEQTDSQIQEVETFFQEKGYDEIHIIGANTNGREHGVPFSYNWYWHSFELGEKGKEVVVLYHYRNIKKIEGYLTELDDETRNKCYISTHFVFYYGGEDENIISTIMEFCEENKPEENFRG